MPSEYRVNCWTESFAYEPPAKRQFLANDVARIIATIISSRTPRDAWSVRIMMSVIERVLNRLIFPDHRIFKTEPSSVGGVLSYSIYFSQFPFASSTKCNNRSSIAYIISRINVTLQRLCLTYGPVGGPFLKQNLNMKMCFIYLFI
jgi:hypothetical protein